MDSTTTTSTLPVSIDGLWRSVSITLDDLDVIVDRALFLEIDGDRFSMDTTCNDVGGTFGGQIEQTGELCSSEDGTDVDPMAVEAAMLAAVNTTPVIDGEILTFSSTSVEMTWRRTVDPTPSQLFAALDDPEAAVDTADISFVLQPSEPPTFDRLALLGNPAADAEVYVGVQGELICLLVTAPTTWMTACDAPRDLAAQSYVYEISDRDGPIGLRVALIPDAAAEAASDRSDLGMMGKNHLAVEEGLAVGQYSIDDEFVLVVPG